MRIRGPGRDAAGVDRPGRQAARGVPENQERRVIAQVSEAGSRRDSASALGRLTLTELKLFAWDRVGPIWGVGFPLVLLIIFGSIPAFRQPVSQGAPGLTVLDAYVPILIGFVLAMLGINTLAAVLAGYREKGVLRRLAVTPVGAG